MYLKKNIGKNSQIIFSNTFLKSQMNFETKKTKSSGNLDYFIKAYFNTILGKNTTLNVSYISRPGLFYTPLLSSKYLEEHNVYEPIYSKNINSKQYASYELINIGLSKSIKLSEISTIIFFGINNIFNKKNQRIINYNKDYTSSKNDYYSKRTFFLGTSINW